MSELHNNVTVYLSEELLVNIFKCLPIKSLLCFMTVCKSWYSLIKSPHFITIHFNHQLDIITKNESPSYLLYKVLYHKNKYVVHCDYDDSFTKEMELIFPNEWSGYDVGCCRGVLCLHHVIDPIVTLWNPSVRKLLEIQIPVTLVGEGDFVNGCVRKDFAYGFGFDDLSEDYKVVSLEFLRPSLGDRIETKSIGVWVYSLRLRTWRWVDDSFVVAGKCFLETGVHVNGVIYWLIFRSRAVGIGMVPFSILQFDLGDERFGQIPLPDFPEEDESGMLMTFPGNGPNREHLAYYRIKHGLCLLWVRGLDGSKESWRATLSINPLVDSLKLVNVSRRDEAVQEVGGYVGCQRILNVRRNGEIVMELDDGRISSLVPKDMLPTSVICDSYAYIGTYLETLVLL